MNQMNEMYDNFSDRYDLLISHEDYQHNLLAFLKANAEWKGKSVYEFGAGTGRITQYYENDISEATVFDNSENMLNAARKKVTNKNVTIKKLDNTEMHTLQDQVDIVLEGWSFGHLITEKKDDIYTWLKYIDSNSKRLAKEKVIMIETMGTNVNIPGVHNATLEKMYQYLEQNGYKKNIIKTDYKFDSVEMAASTLGGFFGTEMEKAILNSKRSIIPEYTGIWICNTNEKAKEKRKKTKYIFDL